VHYINKHLQPTCISAKSFHIGGNLPPGARCNICPSSCLHFVTDHTAASSMPAPALNQGGLAAGCSSSGVTLLLLLPLLLLLLLDFAEPTLLLLPPSSCTACLGY
jgi:hypothetical protein